MVAAVVHAQLVQPGAPGQPGRILTPEQSMELARSKLDPTDVKFMQDMIAHHAQAVQMVALLEKRTLRAEMKLIGARIAITQAAEIRMMKDWLTRRGQSIPDDEADAHHVSSMAGMDAMPGMLTSEQMTQLAAAAGPAFDRLFLNGMIQHHNGALLMVQQLLTHPGAGEDSDLHKFGIDLQADQSAEIQRMQGLLGSMAETAVGDIPDKFVKRDEHYDYIKRTEMIPMRDGVKLCTVIWMPRGAKDLPIILTRTPYSAKANTRGDVPTLLGALPLADEDFVRAGYIRIYQDVRGKYGSEGVYEVTRQVRGPFNSSKTDDATDAWDTVDWLVKNLRESNGKVGMIGSSYDGWTVVQALLEPHPAFAAAVPESPMIDGWMGDDWFHHGAFRQINMDFFSGMTQRKDDFIRLPRSGADDYTTFLKAGSPASYGKFHGLEQLPWWRKILAHPTYDAFWQAQALDKLLAVHPSQVPTLWEQGLWDQEDMWGANHAFAALKGAGHAANSWLVMGPWYHSQVNGVGYELGPFKWEGDTARQFRRDMVLPFFNRHLRGEWSADPARVTIYNPAENKWQTFDDWPTACVSGCRHTMKRLYLQPQFGLSFAKPPALQGTGAGDSYVSDPAKPVPYQPRPTNFSDRSAWLTSIVRDQRFVDGRPDVLTYESEVLTSSVKIEGAPIADLMAITTGTDVDFVVKLIDVYPEAHPSQPELGGYQLPVSMDIFRGRYRESFEHPTRIPARKAQRYRFTLPNQNYTFLPGHRIMVQIQSTLFPLYDRNPQTFVDNPLAAEPADYKIATVTVLRSANQASAILLPVVP
jgi:putative CocE/NonD family hydrolase